MLSFLKTRRWILAPVLLAWLVAAHATEFSAADYDLYAGDFNNDGKTDLLYIGKTPDKPSGIALADPATGIPQVGFQSWPSNFLNLPWSNGSYKAVVGDFNGDGCADILLQSQTPGTSYVLEANCNPANGPLGQIQGISQAIGQNTFSIAWSADQHRLIAGDFDGDGMTDLFFQATSPTGTNAIVLADPSGHLFTRTSNNCWSGGPQQCWSDGYEGMQWSLKSALIYAGDFNGDHRTDLLVQAKPSFVMIDYDVPFPVPKFAAQGFGIFLAQTPDSTGAIIRTPNQLWNFSDLNGKWSPLNSTVVVGDFNGDSHADVLLQSRNGTNMLMLSNSSGQLQAGTALSGAAANWTSSSYHMIVGNFGGSSVPVLYLQSITAGGANYITSGVSAASVTALASSMQIAANPTSPATGVGATAGTANVSATGAGTYTIPLSLPRGHAGLSPQLSLQYQHTGKNGQLGIGWTLSGLSIITRCPTTIAQDGAIQPVQYASADQYCLDGSRLRLTSGTQGADGSQYRTELETYSLIIAHGSGTNGPVWFEVRHKDGLYYEYGNSSDSQVSGTGGTRVWALNAIRDRASNYVSFSYFNDSKNPVQTCREASSQGSYRICQILYSGNTNQSTAPPYTVQFNYQGRNAGEGLQHMYLGQSITEVNRLYDIQLLYAGTVEHEWKLGYDTTATASHESRLASVQECGLSSDCFPATTFTWSNQQTLAGGLPAVSGTAVTDNTYTYTEYACTAPWSIDIDGDGTPDTLFDNCFNTPNGNFNLSVTLQFGTRKGTVGRSSIIWNKGTTTGGTTIDLSSWIPLGVMDLDGDGKQDFLFFTSAGTFWIHQRASDGTVVVEPTPIQIAPMQTGGVVAFVDVDGDGFPDLIWSSWQDTSHLFVNFHNRDGSPGFESTSSVAWTVPAGVTLSYSADSQRFAYNSQLTAIDVNGDGRQDLLVYTSSGWTVLYSNGSGFTTGDVLQAGATPVAIDINGDGCTDFAFGGSTVSFALSKCGVTNGTGLNPVVDTHIPGNGALPSVADINGDGMQDLVFSGQTALVFYSTGTGFAAPVTFPTAYTQWSDRDGDGLVDQIYVGNVAVSSTGTFQTALGPKADLMLSATDGFGNTVSYTYAPLNDPSVYTPGLGTAGKTQDVNGTMYVVKQLQSGDGVGGNYSLTYQYSSAHKNVQGRGFLGFGTRTITDSRTGIVTQETYNNTLSSDGSGWELIGTLAEKKSLQWAGGPILQDTINHWSSIAPDNSANRRYPYLSNTTLMTYELGNSSFPVTTKSTTTSVDNYGTPYDVLVVSTEGSSGGTTGLHQGSSLTQHSVVSQILNDTTNWCLSKPQLTTVTSNHTLSGGEPISQTVTRTWDAGHCRLTDKTLDAGTSWSLDVGYDYDSWNNIWHQTVKAANMPQAQRVTTFDYSTSTTPGQFLMTVTNALGQATKYTWDPRGLKSTTKDPNGFVTSWEYDDFGREKHELRPDHTGSRRSYSACTVTTTSCGDSLLRYMVQEDERDANDNIVNYRYEFFDGLRRIKYDETLGYSGALSVTETLYDQRGNVVERSTPYYAGTDPYKGTSLSYDLYNRVTTSQRPTSDADATPAITTTVYHGLTITVSDPLGNARTQVSNAWGDILEVIDEGGNTTQYAYDSLSNLNATTDAKGNQSTSTYTDRGFRLTSSDPDMGTWTYAYDGAGEMLSRTDAKGQQTLYHYDALGRVDNRTDPGASSPDTVWSWDTATNGIGKVGSVSGPLGYVESYSYEGSAGRMVGESITANGGTYALNYGYDPVLGALQTITYPTSSSGRFEVLYDYQNGYLKDVKDYNNQSTVFWQAIAQDARGHVIQEQSGNGQQSYLYFDETNGLLNSVQTGVAGGSATQNLSYNWDRAGNLLSREDANQNLSEGFTYDSLYRLQTASLNGTQTLSLTYDAIGNISTKSDVSSVAGGTNHTYDYTTAQSTCSYSGLTAQPHAVRNAGGIVYCYDANGNMVSRNAAIVSWYPYNMPQTINQNGGNYSTFYYAPDRSRYRQTSLNGSVTEDRIYIGGLFEKLSSSAVGTEYRHYIVANGEKVAIKVLSTSRNDTLYLHTDHLGSSDVITDQTGALKIRESYDAWGQRRAGKWSGAPSAADSSTISTTTHIGYTGQEELDNLGLVHLNGRVYDPTIGRFMSADPHLSPYESQSLNRYSYTINNPLNQTDPTGFDACTTPGSSTCDSGEGDQVQQSSQQPAPAPTTEPVSTVTVTGSSHTDATNNSAQQTTAVAMLTAVPTVAEETIATVLITAARKMGQTAVRWVAIQATEAAIATALILTPSNGWVGSERERCMDEALCTRVYNQAAGENGGGSTSGNSEDSTSDTSSDPGDDDDNGSEGENRPKRITNEKHHPNSKSPEPKNVQELYDKSIADKKGRRWAIDSNGEIHRFSKPSNGETHWNGSTAGEDGIRPENIPQSIRDALGYKL